MAPVNPGEPRPAPKPQPLGTAPLIFLATTAAFCILFVLWRRAAALRSVVSHQLQTWQRKEGQIRLSTDDGPPASSFLEDDDPDDDDGADDLAPRLPVPGLHSAHGSGSTLDLTLPAVDPATAQWSHDSEPRATSVSASESASTAPRPPA